MGRLPGLNKLLALIVLTFGAAAPAAIAPAVMTKVDPTKIDDATSTADPRAILLTETQAVRVATLDHVGPYWALGSVFDKVREAMNARGQPGPLVVRYLNDPLTTPPQQLRSEVGFVLRGDDEPPEPFKASKWPPELVVELSVSGPYRYSSRYYQRLRSWAMQQGLTPTGPIVELLHFPSEAAPDQSPRIEIRMPVCESEPEPLPAREGDKLPVAPPESPGNAQALAMASSSESPTAPSASDVAPSSKEMSGDDEEDAGASDRRTASLANADLHEPAAKTSRGVAIRNLIDAGRFDDLAEQMLPDDPPMSDTNRAWLQQFVLRVSALARGIQKQHPGQDGWLVPLSRALVQRNDRAKSATRAEASVERRVPRGLPASDPGAERRKAIIRRLELLMARVGMGSIEPNDVRNELALLLQEAQDLLDAARR
jgi:effector-binding domain-containing protein